MDGPKCVCLNTKAQIEFLAGELSRARIRPAQDRCCRCIDYGYEACKACWIHCSEVAAYKASLLESLEEHGD